MKANDHLNKPQSPVKKTVESELRDAFGASHPQEGSMNSHAGHGCSMDPTQNGPINRDEPPNLLTAMEFDDLFSNPLSAASPSVPEQTTGYEKGSAAAQIDQAEQDWAEANQYPPNTHDPETGYKLHPGLIQEIPIDHEMHTPRRPFETAETIGSVLGELAGAASVCWETPEGAGEFLSGRAGLLVDKAQRRIVQLIRVELDYAADTFGRYESSEHAMDFNWKAPE